VYFVLAGFSLAAAFVIGPTFEIVHAKWLAPSAFSLFALLVLAFDHYIWSIPRIMQLHGIPNIGGIYNGTVERGTKGETSYEQYEVTVTIKQTWTKIDMVLNSGDTISHLRTCGFFIANQVTPSIQYTYLVKDMDGQQEKSKYGEGTAELYISGLKGQLYLGGKYYSTKNRSGVITFCTRSD